jgi:hypothetical protein
MIDLSYTCRICRGAFTCLISPEDEQAMQTFGLTKWRPTVCKNCDNTHYTLTADEASAAEAVSALPGNKKAAVIEHFENMRDAYKTSKHLAGKFTTSQLRGISKYIQMLALAKAGGGAPQPEKSSTKWRRDPSGE